MASGNQLDFLHKTWSQEFGPYVPHTSVRSGLSGMKQKWWPQEASSPSPPLAPKTICKVHARNTHLTYRYAYINIYIICGLAKPLVLQMPRWPTRRIIGDDYWYFLSVVVEAGKNVPALPISCLVSLACALLPHCC